MNLERLRWGEWIAAISALDLLLVTFRSWYKVTGGGRVTAWDALEQGRYLLLATALVGIFLWIARAAEDTPPRLPIGWITAGVGLACTVYIAYRLATPPADDLDPDVGIFLGLAGALGVAIGGLLSAREPESAYVSQAQRGEPAADTDTAGPTPFNPAAPSNESWSPAAPAASTSGWSPAAPTAPVPPATAAGAVGTGERPLQSGESVVLTAGGARFPAGTVAAVVEVFAGGALVEVTAPDGVAERFEVPESAYERGPGGAMPAATDNWSPAMPAPAASDDWGFDDQTGSAAAAGTAAGLDGPSAADDSKPAKVPWWKREIGGGKKQKDESADLGTAGAVAAGAAGAAVVAAGTNGAGDEKPGFFKRLFGGGGAKSEPETETLEADSTPTTDVAGVGQAAESDTAVDEPAAEAAVDEPPAEAAAPVAPDPEPVAAEPEPVAAEPEAASPEHEPAVSEPEPQAAAPAVEPAAVEPEPEVPGPEPEPEPPTPEPEPEPEPAASAPAPEPEAAPPAAEPAAPEPEPAAESSGANGVADATAAAAAAAGAGAAAGAAKASDADEEPKPKRKRSSGSRKVPKEALAATGGDHQPKVGDEVELKVGGGKFDAGTKGRVVDVFSAGVIVELSDDEGRVERLDLPFEAIGPAER